MRLQSLCLKTLTVAVTLLVLVTSCKKGDTGPTGPAGPTGAANVIYSDWFTPAAYKKDTVFGSYGFNYDRADAAITQKIIDSGTVITYGKLDGYNPSIWPTAQVSALPIIITYLSGSSSNIDTWSSLVTPGNLRIRLVSSLNAYGSISNAHMFRYVIIPGGVKSTAAFKQGAISASGKQISAADINEVVQNYQQMRYTEICQRLGIEP
ncbi:MAG TPA: hypothetical protein VK518_25610 [Puia sp.]|nr:hypothetical protein [Puia sp.]